MKMKLNYFRNYHFEKLFFVKRIIFVFTVIIVLISILILNVYNLQIINFENYNILSNRNKSKNIFIPAPRGTIYDRQGIPLAINQYTYQIELIPAKITNIDATLKKLSNIIHLSADDIAICEKKIKNSHKFQSIIIKSNLNELQLSKFAVNKYHFPGVTLNISQHRYYPYGTTCAHVIGYISKIDKNSIKYFKKQSWSNNVEHINVGKVGIERYYEDELKGQSGYETIEVNYKGNIIRTIYKKLPQSGSDIVLTIDLKLQQYIENLLLGNRAAVVVTDTRNGEILSLISTPSYNPNVFVNHMNKKDYNNLLNNLNFPLINRVTQAIYPPASTVKPFIAIAALNTGIIKKNTMFFDKGWWQLPGSKKRFRDWNRLGHGQLNITKALEESADTFFYQISYNMGINCLSTWMKEFGYGQLTGIDLMEEHKGNMPNKTWKTKKFNKSWYQGDTISIGIGQGYWTATPIQIHKAMMTLINEGRIYNPHLLFFIKKRNHIFPFKQSNIISINLKNKYFWKIVKDGMYGVANRKNGTAYNSFKNTSYKIAAKSGTAQVYSLKDTTYQIEKNNERLRDHKLMIAFAPYKNPRVAITIILENGGKKELKIGNVIRKILDYIMLNNFNFDFLKK